MAKELLKKVDQIIKQKLPLQPAYYAVVNNFALKERHFLSGWRDHAGKDQ